VTSKYGSISVFIVSVVLNIVLMYALNFFTSLKFYHTVILLMVAVFLFVIFHRKCTLVV